ncbi:MAG: hypothetical protein KC933_25600, partial [Myxococcales bacterium]|nr:hypothetical protein [Myxococcales bacterium]
MLDAIERGSRLLGIAIRLTGLLAYEFEWHAIEQWPRSQPSESGVGPAICLEYQEGFAPNVDLLHAWRGKRVLVDGRLRASRGFEALCPLSIAAYRIELVKAARTRSS